MLLERRILKWYALQENRTINVCNELCYAIWGHKNIEWVRISGANGVGEILKYLE